MKLAVLLTFLGVFQASASAWSQTEKVTLSVKNASIVEVLHKLEQVTDYHFIYSLDLVANKKDISIDARKEPLKNVLHEVLTDNGVSYKILDYNLIVVIPPQETAPLANGIGSLYHEMAVHGKVTDEKGIALTGVTVQVKESPSIGTVTDEKGHFVLNVPDAGDTLIFSYIGYVTKSVAVNGQHHITVKMESSARLLKEFVEVGYGTQKKEDITGAISSITSKDIERVHGGSTVSSTLAGKISGLSYRMSEGRPGSSASIQIRNFGTPLFVIDGVVEDEGQFNNLSTDDIASISVLKDASAAAIYGSRAANGVVVVTTKHGKLNSKPKLSVNAYTGWQNMFRYTNHTVNAYNWQLGAADAQMNEFGSTGITPAEVQKWKQGGPGYESFNWPNFIFRKNAPLTSINVNVGGGGETTNYYLSFTRLNQDAVFKEYNFNRYNFQSNIDVHLNDRLVAGIDINGRQEERLHPGVPGVDDYWEPLFASMRNTPMEHPFANNNPEYLNDIGHDADNAGLWTYKESGKYQDDWRVLQANFHVQYDLPLKGLSVKGMYTYYYANDYFTNHEFTYKAYTYNPVDSTYTWTGGSQNPWQERGRELIMQPTMQGQVNYANSFGKNNVAATFVTEWTHRSDLYSHIHDVPPVNILSTIQWNTIDGTQYADNDNESARIGYVGRITYNYSDKYYLELSGREDGSYQWPPDHRWGFFPSMSAGWRITSEPFFNAWIGNNSVLSNLKIRASYGKLGDDRVGIDPFAYIPGYTYNVGTVILDGNTINSSRDRGQPVTNITWFVSTITDIGADFSLWSGKLSGSVDYFNRARTGMLANPSVVVPAELGYALPQENLNSDEEIGGELELHYTNRIGELHYSISGNISYARAKIVYNSNTQFGNSWDKYRNDQNNRWWDVFWGYQVIGQFKTQEQINNYPVNEDGQGNTTLLPGDLIYKDVNHDGVINEYDMRPVGYNEGFQPSLYGGLDVTLSWRGFDLAADFSYESQYSFNRNWESRWPFQNGGSLLTDYTNRWHRENPWDLNSPWIPGKYPPLRFNDGGHSDYNKNSTYWLINIHALRGRTMEIGYTLPKRWTDKVKIEKVRVYLNGYNLFSLDNLPDFIDPEIASENSLQYPQSRVINTGINITF
ncbi:MAG: SusC/RagA family TonB-linked outer membrane protein [Chitinophagaceae bacterium]|nr:MAG: SusC/RagA family TonB-linked outer membrane protein [Chitinophagaceae bacterium]